VTSTFEREFGCSYAEIGLKRTRLTIMDDNKSNEMAELRKIPKESLPAVFPRTATSIEQAPTCATFIL
jgi:hypothetical protein